MKIGLVVAPTTNKEVGLNINTILRCMKLAKGKGANLALFGEAFLQGFECLSWQPELDQQIAIALNGEELRQLRKACRSLEIALGFGYLEKVGKTFYSSYLVIDHNGDDLANYRRMSVGWRVPSSDDKIYLEGLEFKPFKYLNKTFAVGLCGDLWQDDLVKVVPRDVDAILWPVFVCWTPKVWQSQEFEAYVAQAKSLSETVFFVNPICKEEISQAYGGAFSIIKGELEQSLEMGTEGILISEV